MGRTKIYIYPTYTPSRDKSGNQYIKLFHEAFHNSNDWKIVNRLWMIGVTSILFNLDARVFVIQWVDLIPFKRLGKLQFILFLLCVCVLRVLGKKIVWLMHNKQAHNGKSKLVDWGMAIMARISSSVIAHSTEGISYFDQKYPKYKGKCRYIPHPVYNDAIRPSKDIRWDYIIWGSVSPRKKVAEFLEYASKEPFFTGKKILVCGYCSNKQYASRIEESLTENIEFENRFLSDDELADRISRSGTIVFTYNADSLLSSGALIYSLNFCKPIIGPNSGNFADMKGIVSCYDGFEDIPKLSCAGGRNRIRDYIKENTWSTFAEKLDTQNV